MADDLVTKMRGLLSMSSTEAENTTSSNGTGSAQENERPPENTDAIEADEPLFKIDIARGKGLGLFATRDIPRGTRIIEQAALLAVQPQMGEDLDLFDFETALRALSHEQYNKIFEFHRGNEDTITTARRMLSQQSQALSGALPHEEILDAVTIFTMNSVAMGPHLYHERLGLFENYSRVNHACKPNVQNTYNSLLEKLTIHASRQINKGEEILTSYINGACLTREERQKSLSHWGFECGCEICIGPKAAASERRRSKMSALNQRLSGYAWAAGSSVPGSPQTNLKRCEDLLELYRFENITDYSLAILYRKCSTYSLQSGQFDKAVNYAKKERDVEHYCMGTEISPHTVGADFWLKHVSGKREEDTAQRKVAEKLLRERMALEMAQPTKKNGGKGKK